MAIDFQYIRGTDTIEEATRKVNENFNAVPSPEETLAQARIYADTKKNEAISETKTWSQNTFSNPNLLINGDFQVWQKGNSFTNMDDNAYYIDRWILRNKNFGTATLSKTHDDGGLTSVANGYYYLIQLFDEDLKAKLKGKTVTLSINIEAIAEGSVAIGAIQENKYNYAYGADFQTVGVNSISFTWDSSYQGVAFSMTFAHNIKIAWIKLEFGDITTCFNSNRLADELSLCQRYRIRLNPNRKANVQIGGVGFGSMAQNVVNNISVALPVSMRAKPTAIVEGTWILAGGNANATVTSIEVADVMSSEANSVTLYVYANVAALKMYSLWGQGQTADLWLDAEIR